MARKRWTAKRHLTTNNLRVLRALKRWSQDDVAEKMGYPSKFKFWQLENEDRAPTKAEVKKLKRIFNCTAEEIFPIVTRPKAMGVA